MSALAVCIELCPDCGREWPSRFGHHNCNFHRAYVHNKAIVVEPGADLLDSVKRLADRQQDEACRSAEYADLGGQESPYSTILNDIDAAIGFLKRHRRSIQQLAEHVHDWDSNDYCALCGADGRA